MSAIVFLALTLLLHVSQLAYSAPYTQTVEYMEEYTLPGLPYEYDALEPHIDEATMRVHHLGHHAAYTKKLNAALKDWRKSGEAKELASKSIIEILKGSENIPDEWRTDIINNGGGYVNHAFYWAVMSNDSSQPTGKIAELIDDTYGNFSQFKHWFNSQAKLLFGSGYTWLCVDVTSGSLTILNMANQETPVAYKLSPVLVMDLWEHAYYLKHRNKRPGYINDWWNVVDWKRVNDLFNWWQLQKVHDEL